jgi:hypothetical protein
VDKYHKKFDKELRVDDFIRRYVPAPVRPIPTTEKAVEDALAALGKFDEASKHFDCGACGSDTCHEMAVKIAKGVNTPMNCIEKAHKDIVSEHTEFVSHQAANYKNFEIILKDSAHIKEMTESIVTRINDITDAVSSYNRLISDIEKIAMQVNMIAINASIEAARAGRHGETFGVVAEEIRALAQSSSDSAKKTKEASKKATGAIDSVNEMMTKIIQNTNASYENIVSIMGNTEKVLDHY